MQNASKDVTRLLQELKHGDAVAEGKLITAVYNELRRLAGAYMRRERPDHTLQATALVHEAYFRLVDQKSVDWQNRAHFFGVAAHVMRRLLIDHARGHGREKRGGGRAEVSLDEAALVSPQQSAQLLDLDVALHRLAQLDPRQAKIVELRFFAGLSVEETAWLLNISDKTVKRDWSVAKAWLHAELSKSDTSGPRVEKNPS
jgi:RNA polymerase sigma-70 factor (ECF subfamily)